MCLGSMWFERGTVSYRWYNGENKNREEAFNLGEKKKISMEGKGSRDKLNQKYLIRPQVNIVFSIHLNLL